MKMNMPGSGAVIGLQWVRYLLYGMLIVAVYWSSLTYMLKLWENEDFNYCYFVPVIVGYLIWEQRASYVAMKQSVDYRGLLPVLLGLVLFWLGELGGEYTIQFMSLWLLVVGLLWIEQGGARLKKILVPLIFGIAMFPLPSMLASSLTLKLKLISSWLGVTMLHWYGMSAYREGNLIDLGFTRLQVVDACSGLRFFFPLLLLGMLLAYYFRDRLWKKAVLALSAIPISILTNGLRIALVGVMYPFFGPKVAEGFFHDFSGWFIFMVSLGILVAEMWLLKRIHPKPSGAGRVTVSCSELMTDRTAPEQEQPVGRKMPFPQMVALLLLVMTMLVLQTVEFREQVPLKQPFASFPNTLGEWRGNRQSMEQVYLDVLNLGDYLLVDYNDGTGGRINLYVAYNESQSKGKSAHSPSTCLPGGGWLFRESGLVDVTTPDGKKLTVQRAVMEKTGQLQVSYYWFSQRGRVLHNLYELKLFAFWDALTKQRTDGALVRIICPVGATENIEHAEQRLKAFVRQVVPVLDTYLPGRTL
jgi:exosortase D (VPLPA-CTERM-specific)